MTAPLLMVIDDDDALRESICELLEEEGYRTTGFGSARSALRHLRGGETRPAVILLDLMIPP